MVVDNCVAETYIRTGWTVHRLSSTACSRLLARQSPRSQLPKRNFRTCGDSAQKITDPGQDPS